jgi:hypothetical protein
MGSTAEVRVVTRLDWFGWLSPVCVARVRDVSASGMQLQMEMAECVPEGSLLRIGISVPQGGLEERLSLHGEVVWAREQSGGGCAVGVKLRESPRKDVEKWQEVVFAEIRHRDLIE